MKNSLTPQDHRDRAEMVRLYQERGPMTEKQLVAAGISLESQARNVPAVAEAIRNAA